VTDQQRAMLYALNGCTFGVGSFEKRFVRDLEHAPATLELTPRQDWYLRRTYWRYRKQIGHKSPRPADYDSPPEKPSTIAEIERNGYGIAAWLKPSGIEKRQARDRAKLEAWNKGQRQ
jgi:hypothetical protein